jgi:ABC-2 type transport system ATP-binding protein
MSALLELGAGFHPELSGRENVFLNGSILGMSKKLVESQFDSILEFSGLERFIDNPVKTYSSGMYVRLGFAVATSVQPDVLLVDEVLAVGDEEFQRRCGTRFRDLQSRGSTVVLVSHGMQTMRELCDQLVWLDEGRVRMVGTPQEVIDEYHGKVVDDERDREEQIAEEVHPHDRKTLEVRIVKAEVIGEVAPSPVDSAAVTQLHTGDTLRVRITVTSESPVRDVRVTCGVYSNTGVTISIATTAEGKADIAVLDGETVLEFVVPNVQFRAGRHDIAVGVMGALDDRVIDVRQGLASFAMITEPAIDTWGVVDLGGSWTVVHPTDRA